MDARQVMGLVAEVVGVGPLGATHMDFGHNSVTYDVALPDRHVMVRMNTRPEVFAGTARNLAILADLGLPVPRVLHSDLTARRYPCAYMILEKIPGRDLRYELPSMTPAQLTDVAARVVDYQRRVATLPRGTGFGWVPIGERGPFASWSSLIEAEPPIAREWTNRIGALMRRSIAREWTNRIGALMRRFEPYLARVGPTPFMDDVTTKNVIVQGGELRGLVDFDVLCYGDPLFMVGLTATAVVADVGPHALFYVDELCRLWELTGEQRQVVAFYAALCALDFVRRHSAIETAEWNGRMLGAIDRWVTVAEGYRP